MDSNLALLFTLLIYLPNTTITSYLRVGFCVAIFVLVANRRIDPIKQKNLNKISVLMIIAPLVAVFTVLIFEQTFNTALFIHEMIRMVYCAFCIQVFSRLKISFKTLYICVLLAFVPNFIIQVMEYLKIGGIISFVRNHYLTESMSAIHLELATYSGMDFRSGSIFINPNVYMTIPLIALCVFLYQDQRRSSLLNNALIVCTAISGILTGSRTSIVVMAVIMAVYYFKFAKGSSRFIFLAALAFVAIRYGSSLLQESRALQLTSGGSLDHKLNSYVWYFQRTLSMPFYWLTGSMGSSLAGSMDAEWGYIFSWYGIVGIVWYIKYYKVSWFNNQHLRYFSKLVTIVCGLVSITASVLLCMPIYSFVGMVALVSISEFKQ